MKNILKLLLCIILVLSCKNKSDFSVKQIALTYVKSPLNVPSMVERDKFIFSNAFSKYNLPVVYSELTTGPDQTQALASGDIQFLYAVGSTSVILAKANGADIKIINTYSRSPKSFVIFSKNIIKGSKDIIGKKVAGPKGTILHELLAAYLNSLGLKESDIQFISMGIPESYAALSSGSVEMALLAGPSAYNTAKEGYNIVTTGENLIEPVVVVATSEKFYNNNKELVDTFINAEIEVLDYMNNNYDEIISISARETGLTEEAVKEMYLMYDFNIDITDKDIASIRKTESFMRENKMIENEVDINDLFIN